MLLAPALLLQHTLLLLSCSCCVNIAVAVGTSMAETHKHAPALLQQLLSQCDLHSATSMLA
jgi:hypothetical protein